MMLVNTGSNVSVLVVKLAITFAMTPLFVHNLGKYDYGLWEMIGSVIGYMGLLDLGIKPAITRYAAKYKSENDQEGLMTVFASTLVFMASVGVLLAIFLSCWGIWFGDTLAPHGQPYQRYTLLLLIIAAQLLIVFPGYVAESYLEGFQKYYLKNNITIFNTLVGSALIYRFITPENGLILLAGVNASGMIIKYLIYGVLLTRPALGAIRFRIANFQGVKLKELVVFGIKSFVQGVSTRIESATDTIVIGIFLGPAMVPFYSIPQNLVRYIQTLGYTLSHAFMPLFSDLSARSEQEQIQRVYLSSSKVVVSLAFAMGVGACVLGTPFIALWIGKGLTKDSDIIIPLLVVFTVMPMLDPFGSRYVTAIGRHGFYAKIMPLFAGANLILSLVLVRHLGIVGVALGSVIPAMARFPISLRYSCINLGVPVSQYLRLSVLPALIPVVPMALVVSYCRWGYGIHSYLGIVAAVLLSVAVYTVFFWLVSLTEEERSMIRSQLPKAGGA